MLLVYPESEVFIISNIILITYTISTHHINIQTNTMTTCEILSDLNVKYAGTKHVCKFSIFILFIYYRDIVLCLYDNNNGNIVIEYPALLDLLVSTNIYTNNGRWPSQQSVIQVPHQNNISISIHSTDSLKWVYIYPYPTDKIRDYETLIQNSETSNNSYQGEIPMILV